MITQIQNAMLGYSIKSLKIVDTHDGYCYTCKIFKNAQLVGSAENGGFGGPTNFSYSSKQAKDDFLKATAIYDTEFNNAEVFLDFLIAQTEVIAKVKKLCKTKTLIQLKNHIATEHLVFKCAYTANVAATLRDRYGADLKCIVNEEFI